MKQLFKDKKYWKEMGILLLIGIAINIACFCMPMVGHCANESSLGTMPYNCIDFQDYQSCISDEDTEAIINYISTQKANNSSVANYIPNWDGTDVVMEINDANDTWVWVTVFYKPTINNSFTFNENYNFTENSFQLTATDSVMTVVYKPTNGSFGGLQFPSGLNVTIGGQSSSVSSYFGNYLPRYPFFYNGSPVLNSQGKEVFISRVGNGINVGDFTDLPPIEDILNNISENYTPHTNSTPPTYDSNLSDGENISNAITGHSNNMNNAINNLGENIKNFFNKLYEKLTNVGNKISQNIYNGFSTLMQNIKDFFGPKFDSINDKLGQLIDHISQDEEESQQEIQTALQGTTFYQDFDDMKGLVSDSVAIWNSTSAPSEYKIPFHVERIAILNCDEVQYIDLSLFSPVFPYLRGVMWALVTYSLVYTVIDSIASYISGGDE